MGANIMSPVRGACLQRDVKWPMLIISGKLGCWESYMQPSAAEEWRKLMNQLQELWRVCSTSYWCRRLLWVTQGGLSDLELCKLVLCSWSTWSWFRSLNEGRLAVVGMYIHLFWPAPSLYGDSGFFFCVCVYTKGTSSWREACAMC